jgi:predicted transglutaminase-like cysteine proteinase
MAFLRFCARYPEDCKVRSAELGNAPVSLTKARLAELVKINRDVNRAIRPQENVGGVIAEEWLLSPRNGDCNDYAVTKRHQLLAHGWPSHSLLLAEVVVARGEHHLVLVVRTREDDLILDNLNGEVRSVSQIEYQWVRAQQAENPKFWSAINLTRPDRVAMNAP